MESVIRAAIVYFGLFIIFRLSGKRTLQESTPFDLILLLIIGEAIQEALLTQDYSITNAFLVVITLVAIDIMLSIFKQSSGKVEKLLNGVPVLILSDGKLLKDRMNKTRLREDDILQSARQLQGIKRLNQIKYAILENDGSLTIIPKEK